MSGEVVDLDEVRQSKQNGGIYITNGPELTVQVTSIEIRGYSFYDCACQVISLLYQGVFFKVETVVLRVIPLPPSPPPEPPKPPSLVATQRTARPSLLARLVALWRRFRPHLRLQQR
jgi:hypothetical protein